MLDPDVAELKAAVSDAYRGAAEAGEMLVLAFIGHGEHAENDPDRDFFFQPYNASVSPTSDTSFHLVQFIKDLHRTTVGPGVDGLLVLVDTCSSGVGA
ncbi:MAG TPA: hypothetical protein VFE05_15125, partial [Longimicrobiaceae bacterium]|nr:hypothetical protein [Longimicrobiaceae bacterium]